MDFNKDSMDQLSGVIIPLTHEVKLTQFSDGKAKIEFKLNITNIEYDKIKVIPGIMIESGVDGTPTATKRDTQNNSQGE